MSPSHRVFHTVCGSNVLANIRQSSEDAFNKDDDNNNKDDDDDNKDYEDDPLECEVALFSAALQSGHVAVHRHHVPVTHRRLDEGGDYELDDDQPS